MLSFFRRRGQEKAREAAAYDKGRDAGGAIAAAIDDYLNSRLPGLSTGYLEVFRGQLMTVGDEPDHPPEVIAKIEWKIFCDEAEEIPGKLRQEVHSALADWFAVAEQVGVIEYVDALVDQRITDAVASLKLEAFSLLADVLPESTVERPATSDNT